MLFRYSPNIGVAIHVRQSHWSKECSKIYTMVSIQTLELALAFEKERSRILRKKVTMIKGKEAKEALEINDEKEADVNIHVRD